MKRYMLVTLILVAVVIVATACGPAEPTQAQLERQRLDAQRALEKLEAERARHALWSEFWRKVQPVLVIGVGLGVLVSLVALGWFLYETIDTYSIRKRQTQVEAGRELAYFPRRDAVLMAQRLVRPFASLKRGQEHAPKMADDEKLQAAVSIAQQAVAARAVEGPLVAFQPHNQPARLPAGAQSLRVVGPEKLAPWVEDVRGQLAAGDVVDGEVVEVGT